MSAAERFLLGGAAAAGPVAGRAAQGPDRGGRIAAPIYREVLILRDIDELTAPEAADHLKISTDAVKSRLHRARQMMREHLLGSGYLAVKP